MVLLLGADYLTQTMPFQLYLPIGLTTGLLGGIYLVWLLSRDRALCQGATRRSGSMPRTRYENGEITAGCAGDRASPAVKPSRLHLPKMSSGSKEGP
jgi:hypothetical protein